jgi:opacity protein-like surface antigen
MRALAKLIAVVSATALVSVAGSAQAQEQPAGPAAANPLDRNVFFFGGRFQSHWFWDTFEPFTLPYEDNYFIGAGYQEFFLRTDWSVTFGAEVGVGARISFTDDPSSAEIWAGGVAKFDGFDIFDRFHVTPSLTLGFSHVTAPIGIEAERAKNAPKSPSVLIYMAPELAVNAIDQPDLEYFFRIQHRSGGLGAIMDFDGSNAATLGVRLKF